MNSNWITSKRAAMRAHLPVVAVCNGRSVVGAPLDTTTIIEKGTGRAVVQVKVYVTASTTCVALSVYPMHEQFAIHGTGRVTGHGMHRPSAAMQDAMTSAGITLIGDAYNDDRTGLDLQLIARIGGCGERSMRDAMLAIAYAAGARSVVVV